MFFIAVLFKEDLQQGGATIFQDQVIRNKIHFFQRQKSPWAGREGTEGHSLETPALKGVASKILF